MKFDYKSLFAKLVVYVKAFFTKPATPTVSEQPKEPQKPAETPVGAPKPVEPTPGPSVIDRLLGLDKPVVTPKDPVVSVEPFKADYHDGFRFDGPGHILKNTLPAGSVQFVFSIPEFKTYQFDVIEVPGSADGVHVQSVTVTDGATGQVETTGGPFSRQAQVFGQGEAGSKVVTVVLEKDNSVGAVVYF